MGLPVYFQPHHCTRNWSHNRTPQQLSHLFIVFIVFIVFVFFHYGEQNSECNIIKKIFKSGKKMQKLNVCI
uniref:Uncharacterized protein n=1 Tax=Anguilla anguilla TaxID=7936 RepID=A0A0E9XRT0_ANGAN